MIHMNALGNNPDEWIEPEKFIPDRFNPASPYYLTPSGKKRLPMSFSPFLGGKRICLGKSFAEIISRLIVPALVYQFNFEFVNPADKINKPRNDFRCITEPKILLKVTQANL